MRNSSEMKKLLTESEFLLNNIKKRGKATEIKSFSNLNVLFNEFKQSAHKLLRDHETLRIGVVGQVKAGKSSFLNSLIFDGEDVLPKASTPMTAGLTFIEYSEHNSFEVEYFSKRDWSMFTGEYQRFVEIEKEIRKEMKGEEESLVSKKIKESTSDRLRSSYELVKGASKKALSKVGKHSDTQTFKTFSNLHDILKKYVGADGEYTPVVKSLNIKINDKRLKGLSIVDTPGVNDPIVSREHRTRLSLQTCHGVFFLSSSSDFMGSADVAFLNNRIGGCGIGAIVLLASKYDSVLQDIGAGYKMNNHSSIPDLSDIDEEQREKFKKRLKDISSTIVSDELYKKIELDTTCGIGYSIAAKKVSNLDHYERIVVENMRKYYPDYFENDEITARTFSQLANITEIKEKYLEGKFIANKNDIIRERLNTFWEKQREEIYLEIQKVYEEIDLKKKQLEETDKEEIAKIRKTQTNLFKKIKKEIADIVGEISNKIQKELNEISERLKFLQDATPDIEEIEVPIKYKTWLFPAEKTILVESYNLQMFVDHKFKNGLETYVDEWSQEWKNLYKEKEETLFNGILKVIGNSQEEIVSKHFEQQYYRQLLRQTISNLGLICEIEGIDEIKSEILKNAESLRERSFDHINNDQLKSEKETIDEAKKKAEWHRNELAQRIEAFKEPVVKEVRDFFNDKAGKMKESFEKMREGMSTKLEENGKKYLDDLDKDLESRSVIVPELEEMSSYLNKMVQLYR